MSWESLKAAVEAVITDNGNNEITGEVLRTLFNTNIIPQLGANIEYKGIAVPSTNPGTLEKHVFYFATELGVYSNLGGFTKDSPTLSIISNITGAWVNSELAITSSTLGFLNVSTAFPLSSGYYTVSTAAQAIPTSLRKAGFKIRIATASNTFKDYKFRLSTFNTNQWNDSTNWDLQPSKIEDKVGFYNTDVAVSQNKATEEILSLNSRFGQVDGDYYYKSGYYANGSTGLFVVQTGVKTTGFIRLTQSDVLRASGVYTSNASIASIIFYDSSKNIISSLVFAGNQLPFTVNSGNIPSNTAFCVLNAAEGAETWIELNGKLDLLSRVTYLEEFGASEVLNTLALNNDEAALSQDLITKETLDTGSRIGAIDGSYYRNVGAYMNISGNYVTNQTAFKITGFIKLTQSDTIEAGGTSGNGTSYYDINFFDSNKQFISGLNFTSNQRPFTLGSAQIPANTAFCVLNSLAATTTDYIKINGKANFDERLESLSSDVENLSLSNRNVTGNWFQYVGQYLNTSGNLVTNAPFKCTDFIELTQSDEAKVWGTYGNNTSVFDVLFFDSSKTVIGMLYYASNQRPFILNESNIPANTAYMRLNSLVATTESYFVKNRYKDLKLLSQRSLINYWFGKKWTSLGDSITALSGWQRSVSFLLGTTEYVRGVGSSAMTSNFTGVAVEPDGTYIDRRPLYASDQDFLDALALKGFTNEVTSPTWNDYAANPGGYTLPAESYFLIGSQGSSQDRVNTIPLDSEIVSIMFMTNDMFGSATVGNIDDYDNGTFIGEYRRCLDLIDARVPNAKVVLCIAPKASSEYDSGNNIRTATGFLGDNLRQAIRDISDAYGYPLVDFSKGINFKNLDKLSDGIHPNTNGQNIMSEIFALTVNNINTYF